MRLFGVLAIMLAVCFSYSAFAAIEGFPSSITFYEEAQKISFKVTNPADTMQRESIEFLAPVEVLVSAPLNIAAGKDANALLTLTPRKELTGQTYEGILIVKVGTNETRKSATVIFKSAQEKPVVPEDENKSNIIDANAFNSAFTGVVSFVSGINSEVAVDIVLAVIVIILAIALFARITKRI